MRGRLLRLCGLALQIAPWMAFVGPMFLAAQLRANATVMAIVLVVAIFAAWELQSRGREMSRRGRQLGTRTISEVGDEPYVLYLRPFTEDRTAFAMPTELYSVGRAFASMMPGSTTLEEAALHAFRPFGRVVAVGAPGEELPPLGAERYYIPGEDWKPAVSDLIARARLVVLVAGTAPGVLWELTEIVRLLPPTRFAVLVYLGEQAYDEFRGKAYAALVERNEELRRTKGAGWNPPLFPHYVRLGASLSINERTPKMKAGRDYVTRPRYNKKSVLAGSVVFDESWTPRFLRFPFPRLHALDFGQVRKLVRAQLAPLTGYLAAPTDLGITVKRPERSAQDLTSDLISRLEACALDRGRDLDRDLAAAFALSEELVLALTAEFQSDRDIGVGLELNRVSALAGYLCCLRTAPVRAEELPRILRLARGEAVNVGFEPCPLPHGWVADCPTCSD